MAKIIDVSRSGGETATVYIEDEIRGKFKLIIFPHGHIEIEVESGEDWAGTLYTFGRTGVSFSDAVDTAVENVGYVLS